MIGRFVEKIISNLIEQNIVPYEDKEIYSYGLHQGIVIIINILTFILIGLFFRMVSESLLFLVSYIPLRTYSGGYHATTQIKCYYLSIVMILLVLLTIRIVSWTSPMAIGISLLSGATIFSLAPVEDRNKPLSNSEVRIYKKIARFILWIELMLIAIILKIGYINFALPIALSIVTVSIMLILGKLKNKMV